ncbi:hypothetical protein CNEO3_1090007 [Clostridium neonatale]|nr:hypothetical protein CNEO3_1090007 [Clostridium neonatale]
MVHLTRFELATLGFIFLSLWIFTHIYNVHFSVKIIYRLLQSFICIYNFCGKNAG